MRIKHPRKLIVVALAVLGVAAFILLAFLNPPLGDIEVRLTPEHQDGPWPLNLTINTTGYTRVVVLRSIVESNENGVFLNKSIIYDNGSYGPRQLIVQPTLSAEFLYFNITATDWTWNATIMLQYWAENDTRNITRIEHGSNLTFVFYELEDYAEQSVRDAVFTLNESSLGFLWFNRSIQLFTNLDTGEQNYHYYNIAHNAELNTTMMGGISVR